MAHPASLRPLVACCACAGLAAAAGAQSQNLHFSYLWHLEQPIYWPERQASGPDRYERAWETIQRQGANPGSARPQDEVRNIFSVADRVAVYQHRVRDSINAIRFAPEAGAQVSYSGGLIENVMSLAAAGQLGYGPAWRDPFREARNWTTAAQGQNTPRLDIVQFSFHHALLPLIDPSAVRKEIQLYKRIYPDAWGAAPAQSRGLFPSEMAFATRLIPILASEGIAWTIVSAEKIARASTDFPLVIGTGGVNCDPPNKADQLNPPGVNYHRVSISRGCAPAESPFSLTPRRARYTDPDTGAVSSIIVVPASQSLSWKDGYAPLGLADFHTLNAWNNPARPMLVLLAHDGDNAWGGGYSYYLEATPNLVRLARDAGFVPTVVEKYLADHPVPADDFVHVEPGAWVNADGCFGSPQFLNWNWPPLNAAGQVDIASGWHLDLRNWAVITAAQNRVDTAEQIWRDAAGAVDPGKILYPDSSTNNVERAWHYFLAGLNSGFMYYGTALDMENKPAVASNRAVQYADPVIGAAANDRTPPTVWAPQRFPWNPGALNFGPHLGYQQRVLGPSFQVYSLVSDVSGLRRVTLRYRTDLDGQRPLASAENDTYAGGPGVSPWIDLPMARRTFPANNVHNDPSITFYVNPTYIADYAHATIPELPGKLVSYYIEAEDNRGNIRRSHIEHVWVGTQSPGGGGGSVVTASPNPAVAGQSVLITYDPASRPLAQAPQVFAHVGFNGWQNVITPAPAMTRSGQLWTLSLPVPASATEINLAFNNGAGTWDNNAGADWRIPVTGGIQPFVMDGQLDPGATPVASAAGLTLHAALRAGTLYLAAEPPSQPAALAGTDRFILLARDANPTRPAMWAKSGQVAGWDAFLAAEADGSFAGWFDAAPGATAHARGAVLEGTIDLAREFSALPDAVRLALAAYATQDNGPLRAQAPAGNANPTIEPEEFRLLRLCELTPAGCCPGDWNADGVVDFNDLLAFLNDYNAQAPRADLNADGIIDFNDLLEYLNRYNAAC